MLSAVADTHALIWYLLDAPQVSPQAMMLFEACRTTGMRIGVSSISIVEIVYLIEKGRIPPVALPLLEEGLSGEMAVLTIVPVTRPIALTVQQVPRQQVPDLPDRIIAATALHLNVPLITRDRKIQLPALLTVW